MGFESKVCGYYYVDDKKPDKEKDALKQDESTAVKTGGKIKEGFRQRLKKYYKR